MKMRIQAPGNLLCFAVELGFFLRDRPTPFTTTVAATGLATGEYQQNRVSTAHVAAAPGGQGFCVVVCVVLSHLS